MNRTVLITLSQPESLIILIIFYCFPSTIYSQIYQDRVYSNDIKTVQLYRNGWVLSDPVIQLSSSEQLLLSFDDLSSEVKNYQYTILHCSANWELTNLLQTEYLKGFHVNEIDDYNYSFNTNFEYVQYQLLFPNEDVQPVVSGNYIIKVFQDNDQEHPVFIKQFRVTEQIVNIVPECRFPINQVYRNTMQQINVKVLHPDLEIVNPNQEVKLFVQQNGRTDNMAANIKPDFIRPNELVYEYKKEMMFEGGNEFRWLDIRSKRFLPEHVKSIELHQPYYHAELFPDQIRFKTPYFYKEDSNGKFIVSVREYDNPSVDADYLFVHFFLPMEAPFLDGDIYVSGGLTDWNFSAKNKMNYNFETMQYELSLLLKQGFYNYCYYKKPKNSDKAEVTPMEGSHSITENEYYIYVYFRGPSDYYDRLIGVESINTLKPKPIW